ncbi:MAG TPA: His/Gly/Thr/Pro-type tRNA ligase C-terminal domain-containing protein, partial [Candidatus Nanoarchaeia archaeon]|nr:His/Gly/Thr/Pro-type tRNA ligase C-terminal domain-containing protein [Candidatus Nanoarchaeia archaeon]
LDMSQPERFDLEYADKDGTSKRPIMLHRVVYGAIERFMGILVEHLNGKLPLWLSPIQVKILTINDQAVSFAQKVAEILKEKDIRVEIDDRTETLGKKVREAQLEKVNYIVTIGDKEVDNSTLAVRTRSGEQRFGVKAEEFIDSLVEEVRARRI